MRLNADNTFSLQESGQTYSGTFLIAGNTLKLDIANGVKTTASIQGESLVDSSGQTWTRRESSAPAPSAKAVIRNQDVLKMVKAGIEETLIIAKIAASSCQFDTSPDALIEMKQAGTSAAVLKAVLSAAN